jgi:hypothetical protein
LFVVTVGQYHRQMKLKLLVLLFLSACSSERPAVVESKAQRLLTSPEFIFKTADNIRGKSFEEGEDATSAFSYQYFSIPDRPDHKWLRCVWNGGVEQLPIIQDFYMDARQTIVVYSQGSRDDNDKLFAGKTVALTVLERHRIVGKYMNYWSLRGQTKEAWIERSQNIKESIKSILESEAEAN